MKPRTCNQCGEHKPVEDFYPRRLKCKPCHGLGVRQWKEENRERVRDARRADYQRNKQTESEKARAWRQANKERHSANARAWHLANRERSREHDRKWVRNNYGKVLAINAKWRAAKRRAVAAWADLKAISAIYVEASSRPGHWHVDHIVPLQSQYVCGLHCEANLQILSNIENDVKGNRWWPDMFEGVGR